LVSTAVFRAAETEIQISGLEHRARQLHHIRATTFGQLGQRRSPRVSQAEQLGGLVEGLASRVVERFSQQLVLADSGDAHQLAVAARNQQGHERETRRPARQQWRQQVTFEMVHRHAGPLERRRQRLGKGRTDQQGARQTRSLSVGNGIDLGQRAAAVGKNLAQQGYDATDMIARGEFGHHPAVGLMHAHLRVQGVREQGAAS
jgi:hypothetical protein